jgi:glucose/arabinose dehydrogenase
MRSLVPALGIALVVTVAPACASDDVPASPDEAPGASAAASASTSPSPSPTRTASPSRTRPEASRALPTLRVRRVVDGLDNPWDVKRLPGGTLLVTERDRARLSTYSGGERSDGGQDVRVVAWELSQDRTEATRLRTVVAGFPTTSGRHGGCRLLVARNGALHVGTGDAAVGTNPRDLKSLGGKTLRVDPRTGKPWPGNPFEDAASKRKRYVFTYGHRNVQGLAQRKDGSVWSVEHGSYRDDEVNRLRKGGDYGWHPVPGYDESVPMTDRSLPGKQVGARWSSGEPTLATSGAAWVYGTKWGRLAGTLAVAALKANRVVFMKFSASGELRWTRSPERLRQLGRLRSVTLTPRKHLLLTTDNDGGTDEILRVTPR